MFEMQVIGNIGTIPKVSIVNTKKVINFRIAINENVKQKDGTDLQKTVWISVNYFTEKAENILKYMPLGSKVLIRGKPSIKEYTLNEKKQVGFNILAVNLVFLSSLK